MSPYGAAWSKGCRDVWGGDGTVRGRGDRDPASTNRTQVTCSDSVSAAMLDGFGFCIMAGPASEFRGGAVLAVVNVWDYTGWSGGGVSGAKTN